MRIRDRAIPLLQSLLLPILAVGLVAAFTIGAVMLSANDRAILWAEGTPAQLQEMQRRVSANPWFKYGRGREANETNPLPPECRAGAREFSFGSLGEFEAQAAREILELMASEAGVRACLSNVFIINELPDRARQSWLQEGASVLLNASLLPLALVLFVFSVFAERLKLPSMARSVGGLPNALAWGVAVGAGASLVLAIVPWLGAPTQDAAQAGASMTIANVGYPLAFTLMVAVPVIEEVAFRGWMIPLAERGIGRWPAAVAATVLYVAASMPVDAWSTAGYLMLGAAYAGLYLKTRSLPACIVANVLASATGFWLA